MKAWKCYLQPIIVMGVLLGGLLWVAWAQPPDLDQTDQPLPPGGGWVQVVDDETGQPFVHFTIQDGSPDPNDPKKVMWYGGLRPEHGFRDGKFPINPGWVQDGQFLVRILAEGYLPQPYTGRVDQAFQVIRLQRGEKVTGRVLDPEGKPVEGATLFVAGPCETGIVNGQTEGFPGVRRPTDAAGHFVVWGGQEQSTRVVVLAPALHAWLVPVPEVRPELTIRLPAPATLVVRYDIDGDDPEANLRLDLNIWGMPDWKGMVRVEQQAKVPNKGQVILRNVTPGRYFMWREKRLRVGDLEKGFFLERQLDLALESGRTAEVAWVRDQGQPITGQVVGLPPDRVPGVFLHVVPGEKILKLETEDIPEQVEMTVEALTCPVNGEFKTARLSPGDYTVIAEAYEPEPKDGVVRTGLPVPQFLGAAKVTVPADGPPPRMRIEMKPRDKFL